MSDICRAPFDDGEGVGVDQVAIEGRVQQREEFIAIFRLARKKGRKSLE